ncbi:MAG: hypothetical protein AUI36_20920, partial [Cyanobacteria bacterium 13_1_40CM_2_61_4]
ELFGQISIAPEVHNEIVGAGANRPGAAAIQDASWIRILPVKDLARFQQWRQTYHLGSGELATVLLADEIHADLAIIDERAARLLATQSRLRVIGCVGVLETAHQQGRVTDLRAIYQQLLSQGVYIDRQILNRSLAARNLPML